MKVEITVPDGKSGDWIIETKVFTAEDARHNRFTSIMNSQGGRHTPEGTYKGLLYKGEVVMSNTPDEINDHYPLYHNAHGHVLINGLGLGMCIKMVYDKVDHITVIEKEEDVIKLVGASYDDPKIEIIHCDAFDYDIPKNMRYDAVWHDIWPDICTNNLPEMHTLHRKYGRKCKWQGSWSRSILEYKRRQEKREENTYYNAMNPYYL